MAYDPEGLLGCLSSMALAALGAAAGRHVAYTPWHVWMLSGLCLCVAAGAIGQVMPINKSCGRCLTLAWQQVCSNIGLHHNHAWCYNRMVLAARLPCRHGLLGVACNEAHPREEHVDL